MSGEIYDLSLPAHDPTSPKPRGLLPRPHEVEEDVEREEQRLFQELGVRFAPEARKRMMDDMTLHYYYEGHHIAFRQTPEGVEVLAVGWDEVSRYLEANLPEERKDVRTGTI